MIEKNSGSPLNMKTAFEPEKLQPDSSPNSPTGDSDKMIPNKKANGIYYVPLYPDASNTLYLLDDLISSHRKEDEGSHRYDYIDWYTMHPSNVQYHKIDEFLTRLSTVHHDTLHMLYVQTGDRFYYPCEGCNVSCSQIKQATSLENFLVPLFAQTNHLLNQDVRSTDSVFELSSADWRLYQIQQDNVRSSTGNPPSRPSQTNAVETQLTNQPKSNVVMPTSINTASNSKLVSVNRVNSAAPVKIAEVGLLNGHQYVNRSVETSGSFKIPSTIRGRSPSEIIKRSNHNSLERRRREDLRGMLNELRGIIPNLTAADRSSKVQVVILERSKEHIDDLHYAEKKFVDQIRNAKAKTNSAAARIREKIQHLRSENPVKIRN